MARKAPVGAGPERVRFEWSEPRVFTGIPVVYKYNSQFYQDFTPAAD
jgi:hypothetical protein